MRRPKAVFACPSLLVPVLVMLFSGHACSRALGVSTVAETLLPTNTVAAITVPDFPAFQRMAASTPFVRLWNDPAMAAFTARVSEGWKRDVVAPLARTLGVSETNLPGWCRGQVTIALTGNAALDDQSGILFLLDTGTRKPEITALLRRPQGGGTNAAGPLRAQPIATSSFLVLPFPRETVPEPLQAFFPLSNPPSKETNATVALTELLIGQVNSWLLIGTRKNDLEQVCAALQGTVAHPSFAARHGTDHPVVLPGAPVYGWVEADALLQAVARNFPLPTAGAAGLTEDIDLKTLIRASGLGQVHTLFFSVQQTPAGLLSQMTWTIPEPERQGLVQLLAAEPKPCTPPGFVPSDVVEFDRWRVDGRKAWSTVQQVLTAISPYWTNSETLILETANAAARLKDPTFDINTNLFGNLGDDLIVMGKQPPEISPEAIDSTPTLFLIGSPNPPQLSSALGSIFIFLDREAEKPEERDFAGQKIRSVPLPAMSLTGSAAFDSTPRRLHYAPAQGYIALSTDASFLEQFLAITNSITSNTLAGADFPAAVRQVVSRETGLFGFNHQPNLLRSLWPVTDTNSAPTSELSFNHGFLSSLLAAFLPADSINWFDAGLLPPPALLKKYFHYTVYGSGATSNGITWKIFAPTPPALR
jgi:hypothetical protein